MSSVKTASSLGAIGFTAAEADAFGTVSAARTIQMCVSVIPSTSRCISHTGPNDILTVGIFLFARSGFFISIVTSGSLQESEVAGRAKIQIPPPFSNSKRF